jgi:hypothetical protein
MFDEQIAHDATKDNWNCLGVFGFIYIIPMLESV